VVHETVLQLLVTDVALDKLGGRGISAQQADSFCTTST